MEKVVTTSSMYNVRTWLVLKKKGKEMTKKNWILTIIAIILTLFCYTMARSATQNPNLSNTPSVPDHIICMLKTNQNIILIDPSKNQLIPVTTTQTHLVRIWGDINPKIAKDLNSHFSQYDWSSAKIATNSSVQYFIIRPSNYENCGSY